MDVYVINLTKRLLTNPIPCGNIVYKMFNYGEEL